LKADGLLLFALLSLTMRLLVPAGFMPHSGQAGYAITLCSGEGMVSAWVDADGKLHQDKQGPKKSSEQQCAFSAMAAPFVAPEAASPDLKPALPMAVAFGGTQTVAIGQGLAAPPPPSTGPPVLA
jgi:hypothetical protein